MDFFKSSAKMIKARKINNQIFLLMILTITVPLLIISAIIYIFSVQTAKNEYQTSSRLILNNLSFNLDQYLQSIETGTLSAQMNGQLQEALGSWSESAEPKKQIKELHYQNAIEHFISTIETTIKHVDSVQIYAGDRVFYSSFINRNGANIKGISSEDWYRKTLARRGGIVLFGTHKPFHRENASEPVISLARVINKSGSREPLGVLLIDIHIDSIRNILQLSENSNRNFVILDTDGGVIYASDRRMATRSLRLPHDSQTMLQSLNSDSGSFYASVAGKDSFVNYVTSPYSNWTVAQYIEVDKMAEHADVLRTIILWLAVCSIAAGLLFMYFISNRVTKPIIFLSKQVKSIGKGNLTADLDSKRQDEFGILYRGINKMVIDIQEYIERASILKSQSQISQYNALKSQIQPHFLANALESIQMKAILSDQRDIAEMVSVLGQLFRIHIQSGKETVTLKEELVHIHLYIKVQQIRFGEKIEYVEVLDPGSESIEVLHFSLQPFVENAIVHGLEPKSEKGIIRLTTVLYDNEMLIRIKDDGIGMGEAKLDEVREQLALPADKLNVRHIGMKNIHDQIQFYYGSQYGVSIDGLLGNGTEVTIRIPLDH